MNDVNFSRQNSPAKERSRKALSLFSKNLNSHDFERLSPTLSLFTRISVGSFLSLESSTRKRQELTTSTRYCSTSMNTTRRKDDPSFFGDEQAIAASSCSRRLTRAVRSLFSLQQAPFLPLDVRQEYSDSELLEIVLLPTASSSSVSSHSKSLTAQDQNNITVSTSICHPLIPSNDPFYFQQSHKVLHQLSYRHFGFPTLNVPPGQQYRYRRSSNEQHIYICDICGKQFTSQYYIDQHMDRKHSQFLLHNEPCVDQPLCTTTLYPLCQERALEAEPDYGPGNRVNIKFPRRQQIQAQLQEELAFSSLPCRQDPDSTVTSSSNATSLSMSEIQQNCIQLVHACFIPEAASYFQNQICQQLTCRNQLHRMKSRSYAGKKKPYYFADKEWEYWTNEGLQLGVSGTLVVLFLIGWYTCYMILSKKPLRQEYMKRE